MNMYLSNSSCCMGREGVFSLAIISASKPKARKFTKQERPMIFVVGGGIKNK